MLSPYSNETVPTEKVPVAEVEAPKPALRAIDCTTTKQWEQRARERREYEDPYGYNRSRY